MMPDKLSLTKKKGKKLGLFLMVFSLTFMLLIAWVNLPIGSVNVKASWGVSAYPLSYIESVKFYSSTDLLLLQFNDGDESKNITYGSIIDRIRITCVVSDNIQASIEAQGFIFANGSQWTKITANMTDPSTTLEDFGEGTFIDFSDYGTYLKFFYDFDSLNYPIDATGNYTFSCAWYWVLS